MTSGILSDRAILAAITQGDIEIDPFDTAQLNPASYDLTLGDEVAVYRKWVYSAAEEIALKRREIVDGSRLAPLVRTEFERSDALDVREEQTVTRFKIGQHGWCLFPGIGYLMHTVERVHSKKFVPVLDGKALALDTEIPTPYGWTTMGRLQKGSLVYGADGQPTRVVHTTRTMIGRPCYELEFTDGTRVVADANHEWYVFPVDAKPGIRTTHNMAARSHNRRASVFRIRAASICGEEQKLPVAPYTLGAWLGDGTSSNANITSHNDDMRIHREIRKDGYTVEVRSHRTPVVTTSIIGRKPMVRNELGRYVAENGSLHATLKHEGLLNNKHIPHEYMRSSYEQRWALLQGLMDTDGTVHRDDQASITLTDLRLFDDVEELCRSLGIVTYRDERPAKLNGRVVGTAYRLTWRAIPELFRLPRKKNRVRKTMKWLTSARKPVRGIISIKSVRSVPVRCITVEAPDGLFLATRAFIETHNSSIGRYFVAIHATAGYGDAGFNGQYTLEVTVAHPVRLYAGMRIAQIRFHTMVGEPLKTYDGNYKGALAMGPVPSRAWKMFERK